MTSKGVLLLILRCEGIESRVLFPDRKTASCLLKVCVPSGISWLSGVTIFSSRASSSMSILLLKARPPVSVIAEALRPPTKKPDLKLNLMLRVRRRSFFYKAFIDGFVIIF